MAGPAQASLGRLSFQHSSRVLEQDYCMVGNGQARVSSASNAHRHLDHSQERTVGARGEARSALLSVVGTLTAALATEALHRHRVHAARHAEHHARRRVAACGHPAHSHRPGHKLPKSHFALTR